METTPEITATSTTTEQATTEEQNTNSTSGLSQVYGRSEYAKKDFWNERFKTAKTQFDWYLEYKQLKNYFETIYPITKEGSVLMVGCGNSKLSEDMYNDGYKNITDTDISSTVIEKMKETYASKGINITCLEMDATNMTFPDQTFDVVIDKGTLDAIMCGKDNEIVNKYIREITRVMKVNGSLFIISHGKPQARKDIFQRAVDISKFDFMYSQQNLSDMTQLINIFRSKLKDKPLSQIFKDPALLAESMAEFNEIRKKKSLAYRILELKKEMDRKKAEEAAKANGKAIETAEVTEKVETDKKEESEPKKEEKIENKEQEEQKPEIKSPEIIERVEKKAGDSNEEEKREDDEERDSKEAEDMVYNPQRQSYCFIYYAKKLE